MQLHGVVLTAERISTHDPITVETDKDCLYEAAVCEVKGTEGASLKHFKLDCFKTDRVYAFDMPFQCIHAKPQCQVSRSVARHLLGASQQHYPSYFVSPFTMNVANQLYHLCEYKTIAEMCEERITQTELNVHQSNLKKLISYSCSYYPQGLSYQSVLFIK